MSGRMERGGQRVGGSQIMWAYGPRDGVWTLIQVPHEAIGEPS